MPKPHTDSSQIEHHEDGSWTTTTVITEYPATRAEKATAWTALGLMTAAPILLAVAPIVKYKIEEKLDERRRRKSETSEND